MPKAKLFSNGGSQAVRLPAEFRFEGDDVDVRRSRNGRRDPIKIARFLGRLFRMGANAWLPADFLANRDQPRDDMRDPFAVATALPSAPKPAQLLRKVDLRYGKRKAG